MDPKKLYCSFYSFTDIPGTLLVRTLGRGWLPKLESSVTEPTMTNMSVMTVPVIKTNGLVNRERDRLAAGWDESNPHIPADILSLAPATCPILRPALRIFCSFTRTGEACPPRLVCRHTCAMARTRVRRIGANFLRGETQRVRANGRHRYARWEGRLFLALRHAWTNVWVGEDHEVEVRFSEGAA